jgi:hypothetical protein
VQTASAIDTAVLTVAKNNQAFGIAVTPIEIVQVARREPAGRRRFSQAAAKAHGRRGVVGIESDAAV